ncbi:hypothetical protein Q75_15270 [Bacillus coahuilensis p1.1.43]|uniref:Glycosyltransferase 2-like domain-containing protein n=2 Tax=Bacillus coahuilensis TaxID=408580 RepID=A0A147K4U2_9BACI|nr:hypothetical protein Q75_15270 [Bacillus coahuilensis p1.1.43]
MIVKNEEALLERALSSIIEHVDETIIVDTGSEDNTKDIAKRYTEQVYDYEWNNNFSDARNFAASFAKSDWILVLDADEYVEQENINKALTELEYLEEKYSVLAVNIINFSGHYGESIAQHRHARLYKNNGFIKFYRSVHEQLMHVEDETISIGISSLILYHSGYITKEIQDKDKSNRNRSLIENELEIEQSKGFDYFNFGNEYRIKGETQKALDCYVKAYKYKVSFQQDWIPFCLCNMVECLIMLERFDAALQIVQDAEKIYSETVDFLYLRGHIYLVQNQFNDAKNIFLEIADNQDRFKSVIKSKDFLEYLPNKKLGYIYAEKEDYQRAVHFFVTAYNYNNFSLESIYQLVMILKKFHTESEIYEFITSKILQETNNKLIHELLQLSANEGLFEFCRKIVNHYFINHKNIQEGLNYKLGVAESTIDLRDKSTSELLEIVSTKLLDILDLFIINYDLKNPKHDNVERVLKGSELSDMYSLIHSPLDIKLTQLVSSKKVTLLIERIIAFNRLDLVDQFTDFILKNREHFEENVLAKIGNTLYNKNFKGAAFSFYTEAEMKELDAESYLNIIHGLLEIQEYADAKKYLLSAIKYGVKDYRIFEIALKYRNELGIKEKLIKKALDLYPYSQNLNSIL